MNIEVTKDTVRIIDENYVVNKGEYKVNECVFDFSEEYVDELVKKAIFVYDNVKKEMVINNNKCHIPYEVLNAPYFELRVYAYEVDGDELVERYSPTHTVAYLREGSYIDGATEGEEITPSQFEQYEQELHDGLVEVNGKLENINKAITETNNLDIDIEKTDHTSTITLTKKDGTVKNIEVNDGEKGDSGISLFSINEEGHLIVESESASNYEHYVIDNTNGHLYLEIGGE